MALLDIDTFRFPSSLSKFLELKEPWLDSSWHLKVTTEKVEDGVKETLAEGDVGELEETVSEIGDVCLERCSLIYILKNYCPAIQSPPDHNEKDLQDS